MVRDSNFCIFTDFFRKMRRIESSFNVLKADYPGHTSRNKVVPETIQMGVLHGMCLRLYKWEFYMGEKYGSRFEC